MRKTAAQQAHRFAVHAPDQPVQAIGLRAPQNAARGLAPARQTRSSSDQPAWPGWPTARSQPWRSTSNW